MISELLAKLCRRESLTREEMALAVGEIMEGRATPAQVGGFLVALRIKGEDVEELTGAALAMRARAVRVRTPEDRPVIDTCGTGGDGRGTFNISTAAALCAAAAGACVAKHGNRAASSRAGSADVLEALGIPIDVPVAVTERCLAAHGFGFLFAQKLHPAMKHAAAPRRELGLRTVFNLLGPLCNPADAPFQVLGVFDRAWLEPLARVLANLGSRRAMVVCGRDGVDEISLSSETDVAELVGGEVRVYTVRPESAGLARAAPESLGGGDAAHNAGMIRRVLGGELGPARDVVILNAAAAMVVAGLAGDLREGAFLIARVLDNGIALARLEDVKRTLSAGENR
jgi:anthranilate phosphoribosyltransferase